MGFPETMLFFWPLMPVFNTLPPLGTASIVRMLRAPAQRVKGSIDPARKDTARRQLYSFFWAAIRNTQSWVVKTTQKVSVISGHLACRTTFSLRALGRTMPSFHHQWLAAVLGISALSSSIPSLSHKHVVSSSVRV